MRPDLIVVGEVVDGGLGLTQVHECRLPGVDKRTVVGGSGLVSCLSINCERRPRGFGQFGLDPNTPAAGLEPILDLVENSILELVRASLATGATEPSRMNFLLSDGRHLVASRWGNTLHWVFRSGISDCSFCGTSHCPEAGAGYKAVAVASEPITDEDWREIPEGTILGVAPGIATTTRGLVGSPATTADLQ